MAVGADSLEWTANASRHGMAVGYETRAIIEYLEHCDSEDDESVDMDLETDSEDEREGEDEFHAKAPERLKQDPMNPGVLCRNVSGTSIDGVSRTPEDGARTESSSIRIAFEDDDQTKADPLSDQNEENSKSKRRHRAIPSRSSSDPDGNTTNRVDIDEDELSIQAGSLSLDTSFQPKDHSSESDPTARRQESFCFVLMRKLRSRLPSREAT